MFIDDLHHSLEIIHLKIGFENSSLNDARERSIMRKRASPWSQKEHAAFLSGLDTFGKGEWKNISRHFVVTRTPTQVASHAQKYFIRIARKTKGRRKSVFDSVEVTDENDIPLPRPRARKPPPVVQQDGLTALHAGMSFWTLVASQYESLLRTHEIRKPIPLRDTTNVMQALLT